MWIYLLIGIVMFVVGFLVGFYWSVAKFKLAMAELTAEMEEYLTIDYKLGGN